MVSINVSLVCAMICASCGEWWALLWCLPLMVYMPQSLGKHLYGVFAPSSPATTSLPRLYAERCNRTSLALHSVRQTVLTVECRLHIQLPELLKRDFDFNVVIILDGWDFVSESLRLYLQVQRD